MKYLFLLQSLFLQLNLQLLTELMVPDHLPIMSLLVDLDGEGGRLLEARVELVVVEGLLAFEAGTDTLREVVDGDHADEAMD